MKKEECVKLLTVIKAVFPNFTGMANEISVSTWFEMIGDLDYGQAATCIKKHIATSKFPPTVNDILTAVADSNPSQMQTSAEAWNSVIEAIRKFGVYRVEEGINSLAEPTRSIMRNQFRELCLSENIMADRAHFMKMYDTYTKRDQVDRLLPEGLKSEIRTLTDGLASQLSLNKPDEK